MCPEVVGTRYCIPDHLHSSVYSSKIPLPLFPGNAVFGGFLEGDIPDNDCTKSSRAFPTLEVLQTTCHTVKSIVVGDVVLIAGICILTQVSLGFRVSHG